MAIRDVQSVTWRNGRREPRNIWTASDVEKLWLDHRGVAESDCRQQPRGGRAEERRADAMLTLAAAASR